MKRSSRGAKEYKPTPPLITAAMRPPIEDSWTVKVTDIAPQGYPRNHLALIGLQLVLDIRKVKDRELDKILSRLPVILDADNPSWLWVKNAIRALVKAGCVQELYRSELGHGGVESLCDAIERTANWFVEIVRDDDSKYGSSEKAIGSKKLRKEIPTYVLYRERMHPKPPNVDGERDHLGMTGEGFFARLKSPKNKTWSH